MGPIKQNASNHQNETIFLKNFLEIRKNVDMMAQNCAHSQKRSIEFIRNSDNPTSLLGRTYRKKEIIGCRALSPSEKLLKRPSFILTTTNNTHYSEDIWTVLEYFFPDPDFKREQEERERVEFEKRENKVRERLSIKIEIPERYKNASNNPELLLAMGPLGGYNRPTKSERMWHYNKKKDRLTKIPIVGDIVHRSCNSYTVSTYPYLVVDVTEKYIKMCSLLPDKKKFDEYYISKGVERSSYITNYRKNDPEFWGIGDGVDLSFDSVHNRFDYEYWSLCANELEYYYDEY